MLPMVPPFLPFYKTIETKVQEKEQTPKTLSIDEKIFQSFFNTAHLYFSERTTPIKDTKELTVTFEERIKGSHLLKFAVKCFKEIVSDYFATDDVQRCFVYGPVNLPVESLYMLIQDKTNLLFQKKLGLICLKDQELKGNLQRQAEKIKFELKTMMGGEKRDNLELEKKLIHLRLKHNVSSFNSDLIYSLQVAVSKIFVDDSFKNTFEKYLQEKLDTQLNYDAEDTI